MEKTLAKQRLILTVATGLLTMGLLMTGGCASSSNPTTTPTQTTTPNTPPPTLSITSPVNGASIVAGNIVVNTTVANLNVVDKQGQPNVAGEGHLHFYLDVDAPTAPGVPAVPTSGVWAHVSGTSFTFTNVAPGTHTLSVQLVNNDHTLLIPLVVVKITITVTPSTAPTLNITSPANGASISSGNILVNAAVTNFNVVDKQGQPNVSGEGHLHFYMDVDAPTTPNVPAVPATGTWAHVSGTFYTFTGVTPGTHTISVQLVNNDHSPVVPLVIVKITVTVVATSVPAVAITSPTGGASVIGTSVTVNAQVTNFNIMDKQGQPIVAGEGHLHFYLDVDAPTTPGVPAVPTSGVWAHVSGTTYTFTNVAPGTHTISVQLVNNDHTPLIPLVIAKITIVVTATGGIPGYSN